MATTSNSVIINNSRDYQYIASAIAYLRAHYREQPDLDAIARHVHVSPSHLQRLFTQWAGISPQKFGQYLTVEYAKSRIATTRKVLDLTRDAGLSSPGRLHNWFVHLEAMSPGEFKQGGAGLRISYGVQASPFGEVLIATTPRGICHLEFLAGGTPADLGLSLQKAWPNAQFERQDEAIAQVRDRIFALSFKPEQPLSLHIKGTNFQRQVWRALLRIPCGEMTTYQDLAKAIQRPSAARAVGNAVGRNPIAYLIPCHRVLRESGELGGYRWGQERKAAILGWEASHLRE